MRFVADPESVVPGLNEEAYVEVQVGRLAPAGRNPVHVDVEDGLVERPHIESGFLARFAQCNREGIGVSVAVTTGLRPAPELAMVRKELPDSGSVLGQPAVPLSAFSPPLINL